MWKGKKKRLNLTDKLITRLKPATPGERYEVTDSVVVGLPVRVSTSNRGKITKSFLLRSRVPGNVDISKRKESTHPTRVNPTRRSLGFAGRVTVEQARAAARCHFEMIRQGLDPREVEKAEKAEREAAEQRCVGFADVLDSWIAKRVVTFRRRVRVTRESRAMLKPLLHRSLVSITPNECRVLILDIAERSSWQARAALRMLKACLNWAIESGRYDLVVSPCDRINAHKLLGPAKSRQRTLTDAELSVLWQATGKLSDVERDYFRVLLMTGQRRGEVSGMRRREIDWQRKLWTIPQERFKTGEVHIVPLSDELIKILQARPSGTGNDDHLFSADDSGAAPLQGFHHAATRLRRAMRKIDLEVATDFVVHDLRRTVRTRLAYLRIQDTVAEYVIGHRPGGIMATYNLHRYESETRAALEKWQRFLYSLVQPSPIKRVVTLRKR